MSETTTIQVGDLTIRYLVDGSADGKPGLFELTVPPGARVPPAHSHQHNDEYIVVTEGVLRYAVGDVQRDLAVGEHMVSPRGTPHAFSNPTDVPTKAIVMQYPDFGPQYFKDIAQIINVPGRPDFSQVAHVMLRYGLVPVPLQSAA